METSNERYINESRSYEDVMPDTLDLAERAKLGLRHFLSIINEDQNYEMFWLSDPAGQSFQMSPLMACQPKAMEAMAMLRIMSGSREGIELEDKMAEMLASCIGDEGLYWVMPTDGAKPWLGPEDMRPYANTHGQARMMRAMMTWYQYTGNPKWKELVDRMVDGFDKLMVIQKEDYAYVPTSGFMDEEYFRSCYVKGKGWKDTSEPADEKNGEEGSLFNHQGHTAGVLSTWYTLTGNKTALRLSGELVRFITKPKFWADYPGGEYPWVIGSDHAHWNGHWHGHLNVLRAVLEYAVAVNDPRLKQFVRDGYEWARQKLFARIGLIDCQSCGCGRLIGLAVKLSNEGIGDYWEDVDLYIRNHGTEMQQTPDDYPYLEEFAEPESILKEFSQSVVCHQAEHGEEKRRDQALQCMTGGFSSNYGKVDSILCCAPHANMGLFYAWDGMLKEDGGTLRVNLLLNRASPWADLYSYLPYEGKVAIRIKNAKELFVRIPLWVGKEDVEAKVNGERKGCRWFGQYLRLEGLDASDFVEITFPMLERVEKWKCPRINEEGWGWVYLTDRSEMKNDEPLKELTMKFRGNTLIELAPIPTFAHGHLTWPYRSRTEKYKDLSVKFKKVLRFTTPFQLKW